VWRIESARLIAGAARLVRDVGLAEDLAQEALVAALEEWPESGVPDNPGAWLMATAKHRGIDRLRRADVHQRKIEEMGRLAELQEPGEPAPDDPFDDDLLRLVFTACHPVLSTEARVALTLRLLCGLTTREIARAYLGRSPPWRSASCGRSGPSPRHACRSRSPAGASCASTWRPCSRSST
jgi:RNA polymerase sigma factor (sigma-70 family)